MNHEQDAHAARGANHFHLPGLLARKIAESVHVTAEKYFLRVRFQAPVWCFVKSDKITPLSC
jgi:hypothetical protein